MYALPSFLRVACTYGACGAYGAVRQVVVRYAALGIVEWPRLRCQYCGYDMYRLAEGENMAKITNHGGPSNAAVNPPTPDSPSTRVDPADGTRPLNPPPLAEREPADVREVSGTQPDNEPDSPDNAADLPDNNPDNTGDETASGQVSAPDPVDGNPDSEPVSTPARKATKRARAKAAAGAGA